jgi:hypothetical protein
MAGGPIKQVVLGARDKRRHVKEKGTVVAQTLFIRGLSHWSPSTLQARTTKLQADSDCLQASEADASCSHSRGARQPSS